MKDSVRLILWCLPLVATSTAFSPHRAVVSFNSRSPWFRTFPSQPVFRTSLVGNAPARSRALLHSNSGSAQGGGDEMSGINAGIAEVEKQIRQVEEQVQQAAENAANAADKEDRDYWRDKEKDLRKKAEDLRKKEMLLLEKEKDLRQEKKDLREEKMLLLKAQIASTTKAEGDQLETLPVNIVGTVNTENTSTRRLGDQRSAQFWSRLCQAMSTEMKDDKQVSGWRNMMITGLREGPDYWRGSAGWQAHLALMEGNPCYSMIDNPREKMSNPALSMDLESTREIIAENLQAVQRDKHLLCLTRGQGTGKTRNLEESRLFLLRDPPIPGCLTVCLVGTCNGPSPLEGEELDMFRSVKSIHSRIALVICLRWACSWFGWDFPILKLVVQDVLRRGSFSDVIASDLVGSFLKHVAQEASARLNRDKKDINFVLFFDEAWTLEQSFRNLADSGGIVPMSHAFSGVLECIDNTKFDLRVSLVVSSLQLIGKRTYSGRMIRALTMPERLLPEDVTDTWWNVPSLECLLISKSEEEVQYFRTGILQLAASVDALPRAAETMAAAIQEQIDVGIMDSRTVLISNLWKSAVNALHERYEAVFPTEIDLYKALFQQEVEVWNPRIGDVVQRSVFVNYLDPREPKIVPEISFAFLVATAMGSNRGTRLAVQSVLLMRNFYSGINVAEEGSALEFFYQRMVLLRIAAAVDVAKADQGGSACSPSWSQVLTASNTIKQLNSARVSSKHSADLERVLLHFDTQKIPGWRNNPEAFFDHFSKVHPDLEVCNVPNGEPFDMLYIIDGSFVVFVDTKAMYSEDQVKAYNVVRKLDNFSQFKAVQKIAEESAKKIQINKAKYEGNPFVSAMANQRWHFVYCTMGNFNQAAPGLCRYRQCSVIPASKTQVVLGPAWNLCKSVFLSLRQKQP